MKFVSLVVLSFAMWEANGYTYYPYYVNMDSLSLGASDSSRGGVVLSRYYNPYYNYNPQGVGGGMAAFMFRPDDQTQQVQQYYSPDRRRQTLPDPNLVPPQENEIFFPQAPEKPITEPTEIEPSPTERTEVPTTIRAIPEITEPEVEEVEDPKPRKRVSKKKQVKKPVEDDDNDDYPPKMPTGAFFPMFFGYGGRSGGTPGGATAIANAYSTGRGGVATSHATAYGMPRPDFKTYQQA